MAEVRAKETAAWWKGASSADGEGWGSKERAALLLGQLEDLRKTLRDVESRYEVLRVGYAEICDGPIAQLEGLVAEPQQTAPPQAHARQRAKRAQYLMHNLEARHALGLVPGREYGRQKVLIQRHAGRRFCPGVVSCLAGLTARTIMDATAAIVALSARFVLSLPARLVGLPKSGA